MTELFDIILNVIGPIFIIIGVVWAVARVVDPDPRPVSSLLIYVFLPALAFRGMAQTEVQGGQIGAMIAIVLMLMLSMAALGTFIARRLNLDASTESALILSMMLVNTGNYGIPLNTFAFGEEGEAFAVLTWLINVMLGNFLGVYFASRGSASPREALMNTLRVPIAYAAVVGLGFNLLDISVPVPVFRAVDILADAAIPVMLTLLGLQLAKARLGGHLRLVGLAAGLRLIGAPLIVAPVALLLGLSGTAFNVTVVEAAMPTAVIATAFAMQFGSDAEFTTAVTLVSTAASAVTLAVLLLLLGVSG